MRADLTTTAYKEKYKMKRIAKLLTTFVMLVSMFMPSAFALGDYAVWTGEWPFNDNGAYIGFTSSTADYGVAGDSYSSQNMYYGLNLDNDQVIYHDDYYNFVDRDLNDFVPTNWEPLNVNNSTFPALNPLIAQAVLMSAKSIMFGKTMMTIYGLPLLSAMISFTSTKIKSFMDPDSMS